MADYLKSVLGIFSNAKELARRKAEEARIAAQQKAAQIKSAAQKASQGASSAIQAWKAKPANSAGKKIIETFKPQTGTFATAGRNWFNSKVQPAMQTKVAIPNSIAKPAMQIINSAAVRVPGQFGSGLISGQNLGTRGPMADPKTKAEGVANAAGRIVGSLNPKSITGKVIGGVVKGTNPFFAASTKPFTGPIASRVASAVANVAQGEIITKGAYRGTSDNVGRAIDFVTGLVLGPNQFSSSIKQSLRNVEIHPEDKAALDWALDTLKAKKPSKANWQAGEELVKSQQEARETINRLLTGYVGEKKALEIFDQYGYKSDNAGFYKGGEVLQKMAGGEGPETSAYNPMGSFFAAGKKTGVEPVIPSKTRRTAQEIIEQASVPKTTGDAVVPPSTTEIPQISNKPVVTTETTIDITAPKKPKTAQEIISTTTSPQTSPSGAVVPEVPASGARPRKTAQEVIANTSGGRKMGEFFGGKPEKPQNRGLVDSVQEAQNITQQVKDEVSGTYTTKPNPQLMGEAKALLESGAKIDFKNTKDLDQKVAATIQEAINQQQAGNHEAAANLFNNLSEHGTELGRAVQAFSLLEKMSPEAIALSAAGKIKQYNATHSTKIPELGAEQTKIISDMVTKIDSLTGREKNIAINELSKTLNGFIPSTIGEKIMTVWKAGLLTSLRTHERNLIGNTVHGTLEVAKDYLASPIDALLATKTGKRTLTATTQGIGEGFNKETGQQMVDIVKIGYDPTEQINKFDYKEITWGNNKVEQALKKYTDAVFRTLGASDKPFYNSAMAHSLYNQAGAEAINAGRKGDVQFIENLVRNPTEEMVKTAIKDANIATFKDKNKISDVASAIKRSLSSNEWTKAGGEFLMPFTGVPSSVFGQIKNYSPVGLLQGIIKAGRVLVGQVPELQRQAAQEIGRGVIGTGIYGLGAYLMSKGLMTGQPKDAAEQRQWDLENKPRNSVMVNGKWRSLNSLGPETFILLAGGKLQEEIGREDGSMANYAGTLGKDVLDQSFVTGLQQPVNAVTDPARYAKSYAGNSLSSVVPNILKDASKSMDDTQRESNTVIDYAKSSIPGLRNTLVEKRDSLGNVMKQEPTGLGSFLDVFNSKTPIENDVVNEFSRLNDEGYNVAPGKIQKTQTLRGEKSELTPEQLNQLEKEVGIKAKPLLTQLIGSVGYKSLDDEEKSKAIDKVMTDVRKEVRNTITIDSPTTTSKTKTSGKTYYDMNGKSVDTANVMDMPESTPLEKAKKNKSKWAIVDDISNLDPADQEDALSSLGISKEDSDYYQMAALDNNLKYEVAIGELSNFTKREQIIQYLAKGKKEVGGIVFTSSNLIDKFYEDGYISKDEAKYLKALKFDEKTGKASMDRDYKGSGTGGSNGMTKTEMKAFFKKVANGPELTAAPKTKQSQVDWSNIADSSNVSEEDATIKRPKAYQTPQAMANFFKPKATKLSTGEAQEAVNSVRGRGPANNRLKLSYARVSR